MSRRRAEALPDGIPTSIGHGSHIHQVIDQVTRCAPPRARCVGDRRADVAEGATAQRAGQRDDGRTGALRCRRFTPPSSSLLYPPPQRWRPRTVPASPLSVSHMIIKAFAEPHRVRRPGHAASRDGVHRGLPRHPHCDGAGQFGEVRPASGDVTVVCSQIHFWTRGPTQNT